jgi:ABC-type oligopeptide transport system substrate-binding subunit
MLDAGATPTTNAILDLVRPSAFLTSQTGNLYGEGGAIASAELVSLKPETVVYTIAPEQRWSNGDPFDGVDLVAWWLKAKALASVQSDGYRDIKSLSETNNGLSVTATFSTNYAEWNLLFRDIEDVGTPSGCSWPAFLARPTLGPYNLVSASPTRIVLTTNKHWTLYPSRFQRVVITDSYAIPSNPLAYYASYSVQVSPTAVQAVSAHPSVLSHIGANSNIAEVTFAPRSVLTRSLLVREGLSWLINRQKLINSLFGSVTFSPSVASSVLYSQGQSAYPGSTGNGPSAQTTTTVTSKVPNGSLADCPTCALVVLAKAGFHRVARGWENSAGTLLNVRVAIGPSQLDHQMAYDVLTQWRSSGIIAHSYSVSSNEAAARATASNSADVAIFLRPTTTTASYSARSWSGPPYMDAYPSGVQSKVFTQLFNAGAQNFNPVSASVTWLTLDQDVMSRFWVRPLFTAPSLLEWSNSITTVNSSISVPGLVDQIMGWFTTPPVPSGS